MEDYNYLLDTSINEDQLPGGLGDNLSPEDVDKNELKMGIKIELEHTNNPDIAQEIALDHLSEDPHYYTKYNKTNLKEGKETKTIDDINPYEFRKGWIYEFEKLQDIDKAKAKALKSIISNPTYYTELLNGIKPIKKRTDLPKEVEKDNFIDKDNNYKPLDKKKEKSNVKDTLSNKEKATKGIPKGG